MLRLNMAKRHGDWVSYLSHAPFITQNARAVDLLLNSYKTRLSGLLIV